MTSGARPRTACVECGLDLIWLVLSALAVGCASAPPPPDESALSAAGFKVVVAKAPQQQEHLRSLTPGQLTAMERNGTPFFIYPDAATFPPGVVQAVALEDVVNGLIYELGKALGI